jgi:hypothetical protein
MKRKAHFQRTFSGQSSFEKYGRKSKREQFLEEMNRVVPWAGLLALVEPHYPKAGNGRRPVGLEIMLRAYFVQQWFNLSDPGVEDALYDSPALRRFVGVDLGMAAAPQGHPDHHRHDRGCDDYPRAQFDQELYWRARPGDASDQEGEPVVCVTNTNESSWCCTEDGSRPPEAGLQEQASNRPVLLRPKGVVVSDWEKSSRRMAGRC